MKSRAHISEFERMRDSTNDTHVFFDGLECKGIVYSVLASPFESGFEFRDTVGGVPF